jgi:hypothetical protein
LRKELIMRMRYGIAALAALIAAVASVDAADAPFGYSESRLDPGHLYVYDYSENPSTFTPKALAKEYLYISSPTTFERVTVSASGAITNTYTMNWRYMMFESCDGAAFFPPDFKPYPNAFYGVEWHARRDFSRRILTTAGRRLENGDTSRTVPYSSTSRINFIPEFSANGVMPPDLIMALRFVPEAGVKGIHVVRGTYGSEADVIPQETETIDYNAASYPCRKYALIPTGVMGSLFGKKAYAWLAADAEVRYIVKLRDENQFYEVMLSQRIALDRSGWDAMKASLMSGMTPVGTGSR